MQILLSLDPGNTTGYCLGRMNVENTLEVAYSQAEIKPTDLLLMLQDIEPQVIVYEDFQYRNRARPGLVLTSAHLIGVVEAYKGLAPDCMVKKQAPAQGKGYYNDDMLRRMGLYVRGLEHGRDAARHLLHFMTFGAGFQFWPDKQPKFRLVPYSVFGA